MEPTAQRKRPRLRPVKAKAGGGAAAPGRRGAKRKRERPAGCELSAAALAGFVVYSDAAGAPAACPDLGTIVFPLTPEQFHASIWRQHPLVTRGHGPARFEELIDEHMFGLDLDAMLENTGSESPHVWMTKKADGAVDSFEANDSHVARLCYDAGGSLYFQASEAMTDAFVPVISQAVGLNFGAVDPTGGQIRGEIETFVAHAGHTTQWHFDFMENFTLQLRGRKRWSLLPADPADPYRSCASHFNDHRTFHQQVKLHRLARPDFEAPPPDVSQCHVVTLEPGDVLYHPAGVWHKVECLEDSISINISLMGQRWCDIVCDGVRQVLLGSAEWRAPVSLDPSGDPVAEARGHLRRLLARLPSDIAALRAEDFLPRSLFLPRTPRVVDIRATDVNADMAVTWDSVFRRNPLASLVQMVREFALPADEDEPAQWLGTEEVEVPEGSVVYFVHVNFGNDALRSQSEVALCVPDALAPAVNALAVRPGTFALHAALPNREALDLADVQALCRALVWNGFMQLCIK